MSTNLRRNRGFSLIELVLAMGIFGAVILGVSTALVTFSRTEQFRRERLTRGIDMGVGEMAVLLDVSEAAPSFGFVIQLDDDDRNFFDYYPDVPETRLPALGVTPISRTLTLTPNNRRLRMVVLDRVRKPAVKVNPALAYSFSGGSLTNTASASYEGLNIDNVLSQRANPIFWRQGGGILLMSPTYMRPILPINQTLNYAYPPKSHNFAGFIDGDDLVYRGDWGGALDARYPMDTAQIVDSPDKFMWWLPVIGGAGVYALAIPVQFVQYRIETIEAGTPLEKNVLIREEWDGTTMTGRFVLAQHVQRVTLVRKSVSSPLIEVTFVMNNVSM